MQLKTVILGWGSLLWDARPEFDACHDSWQLDGPELPIEFSRISESRAGALTLVVDHVNGANCRVAYALSTRQDPEDAICDLRAREATTRKNIGYVFADGSAARGHRSTSKLVAAWAQVKRFDVVVWTDLASNFESKTGRTFSALAATEYAGSLHQYGKVQAAEYIRQAPDFVITPARLALQVELWVQT